MYLQPKHLYGTLTGKTLSKETKTMDIGMYWYNMIIHNIKRKGKQVIHMYGK